MAYTLLRSQESCDIPQHFELLLTHLFWYHVEDTQEPWTDSVSVWLLFFCFSVLIMPVLHFTMSYQAYFAVRVSDFFPCAFLLWLLRLFKFLFLFDTGD